MAVVGELLEGEVENGRSDSCAIDGDWADINVVCGLQVDPSVRQILWRVEAGRRSRVVTTIVEGELMSPLNNR